MCNSIQLGIKYLLKLVEMQKNTPLQIFTKI